ncbi:unnamed protein product [Ambrosiozyma monospora]|uniref:Ribonuclease H n=1 Tax=Ambrosiozyma monospora TaxID=43982 RepID=A0A9W6YKL6_AMBMO|nr:unnamed protein product [Ambrosiozyma monospora]
MAKKYYAVSNGRNTGVFKDWASCSTSVKGFSNAQVKGFNNAQEARAYVNKNSVPTQTTSNAPSRGSCNSFSSRTSSQPVQKPVQKATVYTDGSSKNNQCKNLGKAGYGVYFGDGDKRNISAPMKGKNQTSQAAELKAIDKAMDHVVSDGSNKKYTIATDSQNSIDCIRMGGDRWQNNGWKNSQGKPVQNREVIQSILDKKEMVNRSYNNNGRGNIEFQYVRGHSGIHGNEMADQLASQGATK